MQRQEHGDKNHLLCSNRDNLIFLCRVYVCLKIVSYYMYYHVGSSHSTSSESQFTYTCPHEHINEANTDPPYDIKVKILSVSREKCIYLPVTSRIVRVDIREDMLWSVIAQSACQNSKGILLIWCVRRSEESRWHDRSLIGAIGLFLLLRGSPIKSLTACN